MDNIIEAQKFAVNEKAETALSLMNKYKNTNDDEKYNFYYGQYLAYSEVYTMLNNIKL